MSYLKLLPGYALVYLAQVFTALDRLCNALWPSVFWGQTSWGAESLSARCYRNWRDGKPMGLLMRPVIDFLFSWQKPDAQFKDDSGNVVTAHCHRAYLKECRLFYLPAEYHRFLKPGADS